MEDIKYGYFTKRYIATNIPVKITMLLMVLVGIFVLRVEPKYPPIIVPIISGGKYFHSIRW